MSEVSIGKQFPWLVAAPVKGARTEMEEWVRQGGFPLLARSRIVDGEQLATVMATMRITPREFEVLKALAAFDSVDDMAQALGIAVCTVYRHLENLYQKFEVDSFHRLLVTALGYGLLTLQQCP